MDSKVGVRELRQNLSKYLARVKEGESLVVTERRQVVARLVPHQEVLGPYAELVERFGTTMPVGRLEQTAASLPERHAPAGTTDAFLAESRERPDH